MKKSVIKKIRWFARILGTPVALFFLLMVIGDFIESSYYRSYSENLYPGIFITPISLALMSVGIIVAWIWEGIGGLLTVGVFIIASVLTTFVYKSSFGILLPFDLLLLISGLLFLLCWWQSRKLTSQTSSKNVSK